MSELAHYVQTPTIPPKQMADELVKDFGSTILAKKHCERLLKQGFFITMTQYYIQYLNEVIDNLNPP